MLVSRNNVVWLKQLQLFQKTQVFIQPCTDHKPNLYQWPTMLRSLIFNTYSWLICG